MKEIIERQKYNREISQKISLMIEENKDLRFIQILCALGLPYMDENGDRFYEESAETLKKMKKA